MKLEQLLDDAAKDVDKPTHSAIVVFRSEQQMRMTATACASKYVAKGGRWSVAAHRWTFPSGAKIEFTVVAGDGDQRFVSTQSLVNCGFVGGVQVGLLQVLHDRRATEWPAIYEA